MRLSYNDLKKIEAELASLPYPLTIKQIRKNELKVIDKEGNELKLTSYSQVGLLLQFILKNCKNI